MFEIRVAVIGYVSVGKTTVINALFGDEYGEVAMKRTTAVVSSYRISSSQDETTTCGVSNQDPDDDSIEIVSHKPSAASAILQETITSNADFRSSNIVKDRAFDIVLEEPLHKMRPDTKLVIVDVPGINEAGTSSKYKDFVNDNWHKFDIAVVVMDARQGVNTEEQHDLLKLVKENLASSKHIPVIVLSNKVDDPHNKEQAALLGEARSAVEKLFVVPDREKALQDLLQGVYKKSRKDCLQKNSLFPAIVPISAMHAFVYRCGSHLSFEEFCQMDAEFIDNIGKDTYGRQWHRFGKKKRLEKAFEAVSEDDQRQDGLEASNFDAFVKVLACCIGDKDQQASLIELQIDVAVKRMKQARPACDIAFELLSAHNKLFALGKPVEHLPGVFWDTYKNMKEEAFEEFKKEFSPKAFAGPIGQLYNYIKVIQTLQLAGEMAKVVKASKELVLQYTVGVTESDQIEAKSQSDQSLIIGSMLLCSSETSFNAHFGFLRLHLESIYIGTPKYYSQKGKCPACQKTTRANIYGVGTEHCGGCGIIYIEEGTTGCPNCLKIGCPQTILTNKKDCNGNAVATCSSAQCRTSFRVRGSKDRHRMKVANGKLVPVNEERYSNDVTIAVPDSMDDPEHFCHVLWKCCQILKESDA